MGCLMVAIMLGVWMALLALRNARKQYVAFTVRSKYHKPFMHISIYMATVGLIECTWHAVHGLGTIAGAARDANGDNFISDVFFSSLGSRLCSGCSNRTAAQVSLHTDPMRVSSHSTTLSRPAVTPDPMLTLRCSDFYSDSFEEFWRRGRCSPGIFGQFNLSFDKSKEAGWTVAIVAVSPCPICLFVCLRNDMC